MITVRKFEEDDWPAIWALIEPVFRSGETYAFSTEISEAEAHRIWIEAPTATYVAQDDSGAALGTYYIKPNQPGSGSHVCNCGYIVGEHARGMGVATLMCEHSQREAVRRGFRAMQFNLVVSTNEGAVRLWLKLGYEIVGTLPGAFEHPREGFVDAFVMYKQLGPIQ
jgi:ribosomal protein S18 acetylase RimI-like enzyme